LHQQQHFFYFFAVTLILKQQQQPFDVIITEGAMTFTTTKVEKLQYDLKLNNNKKK
jgi:hypothetical protein